MRNRVSVKKQGLRVFVNEKCDMHYFNSKVEEDFLIQAAIKRVTLAKKGNNPKYRIEIAHGYLFTRRISLRSMYLRTLKDIVG